jgi:type I restriction enzyme M protein
MNISSEKQFNAFWSLADKVRGATSSGDMVELLSLIIAAKVYAPEQLSMIGNMGAAHQKHEFEQLMQTIAQHFAPDVITLPRYIDAELLRHLLHYCLSVNDISDLTELLRYGLHHEKGLIEATSSVNEQTLLGQLLADVKHATLFDAAAGLAAVVCGLPENQLLLQEVNQQAWQLGSRLLQLQNKDFQYFLGNAFTHQPYGKACADVVVMTPPMGLKLHGDVLEQLRQAEFVLHDALNANIPMTGADSLWVQLALYSMKPTGKAYLLIAPGWLFRGGYDAALREYLVEHELIEAIVQLPVGFLSSTKVAPVLLVLNKTKAKGKPVNLVDASEIGQVSGKNLQFSNEDAQLVARLSRGELPDNNHYKAVYLPEIRDNDINLSVSRYINKTIEVARVDFAAELNKLQQLQLAYEQSQQQLMAIYNKINH